MLDKACADRGCLFVEDGALWAVGVGVAPYVPNGVGDMHPADAVFHIHVNVDSIVNLLEPYLDEVNVNAARLLSAGHRRHRTTAHKITLPLAVAGDGARQQLFYGCSYALDGSVVGHLIGLLFSLYFWCLILDHPFWPSPPRRHVVSPIPTIGFPTRG